MATLVASSATLMKSAPATQPSSMRPRCRKKSSRPKTSTSTAASAKKDEQRREAMEINSGRAVLFCLRVSSGETSRGPCEISGKEPCPAALFSVERGEGEVKLL